MQIVLLLAIILALILMNGFFALAEMAIVASSEARLTEGVTKGKHGAAQALRLMRQPGRFLSSVQTGITLIGVIASAFSGATIAAQLGDRLDAVPWIAPYGQSLAFTAVVAGITFVSVVVGELVPKRMALSNPEGIASAVAPAVAFITVALRPVVWLLDGSSEGLLRLTRVPKGTRDRATEEDLRHLLAEATRAKSIDPAEAAMVHRVIRLADRSVQTIMTPRIDVDWVDLDMPVDLALRKIAEAPHARLVAARGTIDRAEGAIRVRDLTRNMLAGEPGEIGAVVRPVPILPDTTNIIAALEAFRRNPTHIALVIDEHGGLQGIVTPIDILEAIAGALAEDREPAEPLIRSHEGGHLVDGRTPVDELRTQLGLPIKASADIQSAAGLVMDRLGRLPVEGETVDIAGWRFEVLDMDGRRIDKLFLRSSSKPDS